MDTKTLAFGQDVYMFSGCYGCQGTVIAVTPDGVEVRPKSMGTVFNPHRLEDVTNTWNGILHFDKDGKGCDGNETFECGPWYIDAMPFAERKAMLEIDYRENLRKIREVCPNYNTDQPQHKKDEPR